jgi:hypothetical protein
MQQQRKESHVTWGRGQEEWRERNPARTMTVVMPSPAATAWKRDDGEKEREGEDKAEREGGGSI